MQQKALEGLDKIPTHNMSLLNTETVKEISLYLNKVNCFYIDGFKVFMCYLLQRLNCLVCKGVYPGLFTHAEGVIIIAKDNAPGVNLIPLLSL